MTLANPFYPILPQQVDQPIMWGNLHGAALGLALSSAIKESKGPIVIITPDTLSALRLEYEIQFFQPNEFPIIHFPDWETLPYDHFSPHQDIISSRLAALNKIPNMQKGVIIAPITTLMYRLPPVNYLAGNIFIFKQGDFLNIDQTRKRLENAGYRCVSQVTEHGEFAVRGSIIDLFPMGSHYPLRIDLFDDEIDSIRTFSPDTQRTLDKIDKIELLPAKEFPLDESSIEKFRQNWRSQFSGNPLNSPIYQDISEGICPPGIEYYLPFFFEATATLFEYLPPTVTFMLCDHIKLKAEDFWREIEERYHQRAHDIRSPLLKPSQLFTDVASVFEQFNKYLRVNIVTEKIITQTHHFNFATEVSVALPIEQPTAQPLKNLQNYLQNNSSRILFCAETTGRREVLLQLFNSIHLHPKIFLNWQEFLTSESEHGIIVAPLEDGMLLPDAKIVLIAESQLFGKRIIQRRLHKESAQDPDAIIKDLKELQIGSPIVHIDHGVGRYLGLQTLNVREQITEFLTLEYAGGDKLYVPVSSLHLISRYSGADPEHAPLHKLGTDHWQKAKRKAAEQVRDVAAELLDIYARRAAHSGIACNEPDAQYTAFATSFPFEETPDQQRTITEVLADMQQEKPMDRLVCGDVGFGKTEVAMRAAFLAVQNGKQVAVLVPTTLLAQQHFQNFQDRFADWPIQIAVVSRFKSAKEQQQILTQLAEGKIDIIIGTHKLLQDNVKFKTLGLLVIDEEHRFGVRQKEYLKSLRTNVDILTLTATPIPRTLNLAFSGIRDLSLIATPPARRLSIKTFVHEYDHAIIQEAVLREILRGGQVYFLHNDVASIEKVARELQQLIPEARVGIAHGQMRERQLEQVMAEFYHRHFNVLVCTTIIESGIDIPSANTIVINRADKLGLAQLHQLRGRVGRSHHQAYAYLLIPSRKLLSADAEKRLDAIAAYEDLGIGFTLATHDLEIRGAGEFLGEGQSGNMQAIGFTLYMDFLTQAVEALKAGKEPTLEVSMPRHTEIDIQIPAFIPEKYLGDVNLRLQFYKRIASAQIERDLDDIQVEMIDRFGLLPDVAKNLFFLSSLKQKAQTLGIVKIEANQKGGRFEFTDQPKVDPIKIMKLIQTQSDTFKLEGPRKLRFQQTTENAKNRLEFIEKIFGLIS